MSNPSLAVVGARVVLPDSVLSSGTLVTDGGPRITEVGARVTAPSSAEVIDGSGLTLLPGFLDVHIHGGGGADTMDATPDALRAILRTHGMHGTTGLLATTMTQSRDRIRAALANARAAYEAGPDFCPDGARVLGIHLEGPYISPEKPGAQPKEFVRPYDPGEFAEWLEASGGAMKLITMASEQPNGNVLIDRCLAEGIVVSLGHTDATAADAEAAISRGATHATHLFNAMPPIHHRKPGPIPVFLTDGRVRTEAICDGHHIAPEVARLIFAAKGPTGMILITDAMAGAGAGDGQFDLGGQAVTVAGGRAVLSDGTLAGSVLTMDRAAANVRAWLGLGDRWDVIARLTSTNAADELGWPHKGRLAPGADADLVLVDDDLTVHATIVAGKVVYRRMLSAR
jgi:N-acetylglucosamine-6-phosphate deacetylase